MNPHTERIDQIFAEWDKPNSPGCVLAIIKDGEFIYERGYGWADLERGAPIRADNSSTSAPRANNSPPL